MHLVHAPRRRAVLHRHRAAGHHLLRRAVEQWHDGHHEGRRLRPVLLSLIHILAAAARDLRREALVIAGKAALLAVMTIGGAVSSGLFLYVAVSFVSGLWKRLGTCLFGFLVPAMVVLALLSLFVAPRGGAVTVGLALVFMIAAAFDVANLRTRFNAWRAARRRAR